MGIRDYLPLRVEGKRVLDVGASIGESAVLFAFGGARMVVAVEPHRSATRSCSRTFGLMG